MLRHATPLAVTSLVVSDSRFITDKYIEFKGQGETFNETVSQTVFIDKAMQAQLVKALLPASKELRSVLLRTLTEERNTLARRLKYDTSLTTDQALEQVDTLISILE